MTQTLIKNGQVLVGKQLLATDVLFDQDKIVAVGKNLTAEKVIDATRLVVAPGFVDAHVHLRQPGQTAKEDIASGTLAAAHGGYTTVCAMANVTPVPNTAAQLSKMCQLNRQHGRIRVLQYAPVTVDLTTEQLTDFAAMKQAGAFALSNDGHGIQAAQTMAQACQEAVKFDLMLAAHAQDDSLFDQGVINQGEVAQQLNVRGIPASSETVQVARDLLLAAQTGVHYHVCHISTKETVELIRQAKKRGVKVTCEVTPHHLLLTEQQITSQSATNYKMNPPLRTSTDQEALLAGLQDGTIDMIATDHAPHTVADTAGSLTQAAFGITGSETAFNMLYTQLVRSGKLTLTQLLLLLSTKPAAALGLSDVGQILPGKRADLVLLDLNAQRSLQEQDFLSKGKNTPFTGETVWGQTVATIAAGQVVYRQK